jgi:hypothetical protein
MAVCHASYLKRRLCPQMLKLIQRRSYGQPHPHHRPELLEAAKRTAELRKTTLDQLVCEYLSSISNTSTPESRQRLIELMHEGPLGDIGKPLTREEIYAERTWPRS